MKKITLRQFWEAIDNPAERLYHDEDADEILYHCSPLEDSALMEEILAGDVRVQLYILTPTQSPIPKYRYKTGSPRFIAAIAPSPT